MSKLERILALSLGKKIFYSFILASVLLASTSCLSGGYWLTKFISIWSDVHVFNTNTRIYFEVLIWTLLVTAVQFYTYYYSTLGLYDEIIVSRASRPVKIRHIVLQLALSVVIFMAALVILFTFLLSVKNIEIMNDRNVDVSRLFDAYLPLLRLDFLIVYFVLMDLLLIGISLNFSRCPQCEEHKKAQFRDARREIGLSVVYGAGFCILTYVVHLADSVSNASYHRVDNLEVKGSALFLLICIGFLQLLYAATDAYSTITKVDMESNPKSFS